MQANRSLEGSFNWLLGWFMWPVMASNRRCFNFSLSPRSLPFTLAYIHKAFSVFTGTTATARWVPCIVAVVGCTPAPWALALVISGLRQFMGRPSWPSRGIPSIHISPESAIVLFVFYGCRQVAVVGKAIATTSKLAALRLDSQMFFT